jgi:uncharacterized protein
LQSASSSIDFDNGKKNFYDAPFMSRPLPELIDPLQLAEKQRELFGQVAISRMPRIKDSLSSDEGCFDLHLRFGKDESGQAYVRGELSGELQLVCQRCMQPMAWQLDAKLCLAFVHSESQIEQLAEQYEPFLIPEQAVKLLELVEDEVILRLPQAPRHEGASCKVSLQNAASGNETNYQSQPEPENSASQNAETKRPNPFAVLEQLKHKD